MKAEMAQQLTKTFVDMNMYRANFILTDIYSMIRKASLTRVAYCEFYQPWNKNAEAEDRQAIIRNILVELKSAGYKVLLGGVKGQHTVLKIHW